jgi:hypothetical protein
MFPMSKAGCADCNALSGRGRPFAIAAFVLGISATGVTAADGIWTASSQIVQIDKACMRVYTCTPPLSATTYRTNQKIVSTPLRTVFGVCSAGDGPGERGRVGSCSICLTTPPADRCEWRIEKIDNFSLR